MGIAIHEPIAPIMPRYFYHLHDGVDRPDRDGHELPDLKAARIEALLLMGKTITDAGIRRGDAENWRLVVTDEAGQHMFRMEFLVSG